ncbi:MAG: ribokinase, partial [Anaerolineae bacterium]|nr:ribokinase [Anaerolineae bacterium]
MARIVVVGSFNMDLVVRLPVIPKPGETLLGGVFATYPGGKGSNQAVAAARLGGEVTMIGRVGADAFGDQLLAAAR